VHLALGREQRDRNDAVFMLHMQQQRAAVAHGSGHDFQHFQAFAGAGCRVKTHQVLQQ
jgi:hypothetical protein